MSRDWRGFLDDMQEAREHAVAFVRGLDLPNFAKDLKTRSAVQRELFVLGEAAKQLPADLKAQHPGID